MGVMGEMATSPIDKALATAVSWPSQTTAVGVVDSAGRRRHIGAVDEPLPWASVTKPLSALAMLVAIEEQTVYLGDAVGPPGVTLRHLLAHASGLDTDNLDLLAAPEVRRIYSNTGFEIAADHVGVQAGMSFSQYLTQAVLEPLEMIETKLIGSPASGAKGPLTDLLRLGAELLNPTLVSLNTLDHATNVAFPGLSGVLPGIGHQTTNDWGLGFEIRDAKYPHWTGHTNSPETFGHFGRAGGFLWVDPIEQLACAALTDRIFGPWAMRAWPTFSDSVLSAWRMQGCSIA